MSLSNETVVIQVPESAVSVMRVPRSGVQSVTVPDANSGGGGGWVDPVVDWFTGTGPPPNGLIGAGPGDMYIDETTGTLYQLR